MGEAELVYEILDAGNGKKANKNKDQGNVVGSNVVRLATDRSVPINTGYSTVPKSNIRVRYAIRRINSAYYSNSLSEKVKTPKIVAP